MATFANQAANLSALESRLSRLLEVPDPNKLSRDDFRTTKEKQRSAKAFFESQKTRLNNIEKDFSAATVTVFPRSKESKTITELAELCRLSQEYTRERLELVKARLEDDGHKISWTRKGLEGSDSVAKLQSAVSPSISRNDFWSRAFPQGSSEKDVSPRSGSDSGDGRGYGLNNSMSGLNFVATVGGPLESVIETDQETDGTTTPSSYLQSPALSSSSQPFTFRGTYSTPRASARKEKKSYRRKSSSFTPTTPPTLDKLSISATTSSFLQHIEDEGENDENLSSDSNGFASQHEKNQNDLYEFREDDDMITLDTQPSLTKNNPIESPAIAKSSNKDSRTPVEERSQFLRRMEGMLERVEESILEESPLQSKYSVSLNISRPSDEYQAATMQIHRDDHEEQRRIESNAPTQSTDDKAYIPHHHTLKTSFESEDSVSTDTNLESYSSEFDDSTNVVATLVAEESMAEMKKMLSPIPDTNNGEMQPAPLSQQRPTHILVETGVSSPAHTNITMDATMMEEMYEASSAQPQDRIIEKVEPIRQDLYGSDDINDDIENLSTITPVLDRYRLDPSDENSVGLRVVPNKRSAHRRNRKVKATREAGLPTIAQLSPSLDSFIRASTTKDETKNSMFGSPPASTTPYSPTINNDTSTPPVQSKKVYRKTPFPKRKPIDHDTDFEAIDENHHPNISIASSITSSPEPFKAFAPSLSFSVPPLRHHSFEPKRHNEVPRDFKSSRPLSLPGCNTGIEKKNHTSSDSISQSMSSHGLSNQVVDKEIDAIQNVDKDLGVRDVDSSLGGMSDTGRTNPVAKIIATASELDVTEITGEEFNNAPRIVRTHVDLEQANTALHKISYHCSQMSETVRNSGFTEEEASKILGLSEQRCKSILISLCHWRRLKMKKDPTHGLVFFLSD